MSASRISCCDGGGGGEDGLDGAAEDVVEVGEARSVAVHDDRARAHADGDLGGVGAHGAAADDDDLGLRYAGHAAQQDAAAAVVLLEVRGAGLDGQLAGDFTHREEERVCAVLELDRLERDTADVGLEHALGEILGIRRSEVQVRVEDLARLEHRPLFRERLLDLVDHVGLGEDVLHRRERRARGLVLLVAEARADTGAGFDDDRVARGHEVLDAVRRHADTVFLVLDLLRTTDDHDSSSLHPMVGLKTRMCTLLCTIWQSTNNRARRKPQNTRKAPTSERPPGPSLALLGPFASLHRYRQSVWGPLPRPGRAVRRSGPYQRRVLYRRVGPGGGAGA